jgi:hypothetical protein
MPSLSSPALQPMHHPEYSVLLGPNSGDCLFPPLLIRNTLNDDPSGGGGGIRMDGKGEISQSILRPRVALCGDAPQAP